jgi:thymidylate synthase
MQFNVTDDQLSCHLYQRSADAFIGLPFNIAGFALLTEMIAHVCGLRPGRFIHSFGDVHLYRPHILLAKRQLERTPFRLPELSLDPSVNDLLEIRYEHVRIDSYRAHPHIRANVAI